MVISKSLCGNAAPDWVVRGKVRIIDNVAAPFAPAIVVTSTFLMSSADVMEMGFGNARGFGLLVGLLTGSVFGVAFVIFTGADDVHPCGACEFPARRATQNGLRA